MEPCIQLERFLPQAELKPGTVRSVKVKVSHSHRDSGG